MIPILPSIAKSDAEPVKDQVQGLLRFADALLNTKRRDAGLRARHGGRRPSPKRHQKSLPAEPPKEAEAEDVGSDKGSGDAGEPPSSRSRGDMIHEVQELARNPSLPGSRRPSLFLESASDADSQDDVSPRKKTSAKQIPQLTPSPRAAKLDAGGVDDDAAAQFFSLTDTELVVEKYRLRNRAAEAAVQASVERFHRGRKLQEPLLDDLKQLKKVMSSERKTWCGPVRVETRIEVGIRQTWVTSKAKKEKERKEEGMESDSNSSFDSESSSSGASASPRQTTQNLTPKAAEQTPRSATSSKDSSWKGHQDNSPNATRSLSPEEEEQQLYSMARSLQEKEEAQSLRLQRSGDLFFPFTNSSRDWLQDAHGNRSLPPIRLEETVAPAVIPEPRFRAKRAPRCLQPSAGEEALTPAERRSRPGARGRQLPFWHHSAWSGSLRASAGRDRAIHEVHRQHCVDKQDSLNSGARRFIIAEAKVPESSMQQVRTLRLQAPSSSGSSSTNTDKGVQFHNGKDRLAKSCLKPWRSPLEALMGKSFVFPAGRHGSRMSDVMAASTHKGSKATDKPTELHSTAAEQVDHEATSHSAWEAIKRTHGFMMLCQQRL